MGIDASGRMSLFVKFDGELSDDKINKMLKIQGDTNLYCKDGIIYEQGSDFESDFDDVFLEREYWRFDDNRVEIVLAYVSHSYPKTVGLDKLDKAKTDMKLVFPDLEPKLRIETFFG